ncbi:hypothetical protein BOX37_22260 [Nocardia mangyaensis]|uniref:non-specific serine/threonine protein kinase n=2 Tax=Nocardia mangyaensis TaxID=2213200 RepID=A0A1J0VW82_9NOCA|nr:hypothetical protein BOX37_22260 [Nocardia mangyaensis]
MGEVYEAYDTGKDRVVALKLLAEELAQDPAYQVRFRRESQAAAKLAEPHVIPIHDWGVIDGVLFIDMRLVPGTDLRTVLHTGGPLSPDRAVAVVEQIAAALDAAHAGGLVHRDVKPANILVTPADFAYLADFGIAHTEGDSAVTQVGMAMGSYIYMAPERFDVGPISHRADVYSLACVLHECLTGASPFPAASMSVLIRAHLSDAPPRPSTLLPGLPVALDDVIARGMAKDPADRYATAGDLAIAARDALASAGHGGAPRPPAYPAYGGPGAHPGAGPNTPGRSTGSHPIPAGPVVGRDVPAGSAAAVMHGVPGGFGTGATPIAGRDVPGSTGPRGTTGATPLVGREAPPGAGGPRGVPGSGPVGAAKDPRSVTGARGVVPSGVQDDEDDQPQPTPTGEFRVVGAVTATGGIETSRSQTPATGAQPTLIIRPPEPRPDTTGFRRVPVESTGEMSIPAVIQPTGPAEIRVADTHFTPLPPADGPAEAPEPPPAYTPDQGLPRMRPFPDAHLYGDNGPGETSGPVPQPTPPYPAPTGPHRLAQPPHAGAFQPPHGPAPQRAVPTQRYSGEHPVPAAPFTPPTEQFRPPENPRSAPTQHFAGGPDPDARFGPAGAPFDDDRNAPDARFGGPAAQFGGGRPSPPGGPTQRYSDDPDAGFGPRPGFDDDGYDDPDAGFGAPTEQYRGPAHEDPQRFAATQHYGGAPEPFGPAAEQFDPKGFDARRAAPTQHYGGAPIGPDAGFGAPTEQYDADPQRARATHQYRGGAAPFAAHQAGPDDYDDPARAAEARQYAGSGPVAYSQYDDPDAYGDHAYRDPAYGPDPAYGSEPAWPQQDSRRKRSLLLPVLAGVLGLVVVVIGGAIGWRMMSAADTAETADTAAAATTTGSPIGAGGPTATTAPRATTTAPTTTAGPVTLPADAQPCESGGAGGDYGNAATGTTVTSCGFAEAVRQAYVAGGTTGRTGPQSVVATSPVTGRAYTMTCSPDGTLVTCTGGDNAVVYVY